MNLNPSHVLRTVIRRLGRRRRREKTPHALVLMYHRVAPPQTDRLQLAVSPSNFQAHLEVLSKTADVVPLTALDSRRRSGRNSRPVVALTFDDGYADNFHYARPLLERFEAPATIFVATSLIGRPVPYWWDQLAEIIFSSNALPSSLSLALERNKFEWASKHEGEAGRVSLSERQTLFQDLWQRLKFLDDAVKTAALAELKTWLKAPASVHPEARPMTHEELVRLHDSKLISIGAHTQTHPTLPSLTAERQFEEIQKSREDCERFLGTTPATFAYPYGDLGPETPALVERAGFKHAYSTRPELSYPGDHPLLVPRFGVANWSGEAFERNLRREWLP